LCEIKIIGQAITRKEESLPLVRARVCVRCSGGSVRSLAAGLIPGILMKLKNTPSCADERERAVRVENYVKNSPKIITTLPLECCSARAPARAENKNTQIMHCCKCARNTCGLSKKGYIALLECVYGNGGKVWHVKSCGQRIWGLQFYEAYSFNILLKISLKLTYVFLNNLQVFIHKKPASDRKYLYLNTKSAQYFSTLESVNIKRSI
jgi:hypothetical protein